MLRHVKALPDGKLIYQYDNTIVVEEKGGIPTIRYKLCNKKEAHEFMDNVANLCNYSSQPRMD